MRRKCVVVLAVVAALLAPLALAVPGELLDEWKSDDAPPRSVALPLRVPYLLQCDGNAYLKWGDSAVAPGTDGTYYSFPAVWSLCITDARFTYIAVAAVGPAVVTCRVRRETVPVSCP